MKKKVFVTTILVLLILGYFVQFVLLLMPWAGSVPGRHILFFMCVYGLFYLFTWLLLLRIGLQKNSKTLKRLYGSFWVMSSIYFAIFLLVPDEFIGMGFFPFLLPLIGIETFLRPLAFYSDALYISATISFGMLLVPFLLGKIKKWRGETIR